MKIVMLSDTHENHREVSVPDGDILIHAGDVTMNSRSVAALKDFNEWLGELPHEHKFVVPGNHDHFFLETQYREMLTNARLLINEAVELEGLTIWGSPVDPYADSPYGIPDDKERAAQWATMPADLDVLVTHFPPYGVLDWTVGQANIGCKILKREIVKKRPRVHVFGHQHSGFGLQQTKYTDFANVAMPDADFGMTREPAVVTIDS